MTPFDIIVELDLAFANGCDSNEELARLVLHALVASGYKLVKDEKPFEEDEKPFEEGEVRCSVTFHASVPLRDAYRISINRLRSQMEALP